jgi:zinc metalloprotease ZmpB
MARRSPLVAALALVASSLVLTAAGKPPSGSTVGVGTVFLPNPVADLGDETLTDQKDADYPALAPAYHDVVLTNLDGSGFLVGDWAQVVSETGAPAYSPSNEFRYRRDDDRFEQVMAYYWVTESQKYIQSLGFGSIYPPVNKESQDVRIDQYGADNSFETDHPKDEIRFGKGGVDDAEDAEVILHEYGHAIHDGSGFVFGSEQAGAISEGFGDYWAVDFSDVQSQKLGVPELEPLPCVMDWDATFYTSTVPHCLRRLDEPLKYPGDLDGEVHDDGRIWSHALWNINRSIGHIKADTVILKGQIDFPGTTMPDLASRIVAAAQNIYGPSTATKVRAAFQDRGIL